MDNLQNTEDSVSTSPEPPFSPPLSIEEEEHSNSESPSPQLSSSRNQADAAFFREQELILSNLNRSHRHHNNNNNSRNRNSNSNQSTQSGRHSYSRPSDRSNMSDSSSLSSNPASNHREDKDDDNDSSRGIGFNQKFYGDHDDRMNADMHIAGFETAMRIKKMPLESRNCVDTFSLTLKGNAQQWFFTEIKGKYETEYIMNCGKNTDQPSPALEKLIASSPCKSFEVCKKLFLEYFSDPTDQTTIMVEIQSTKLTDFATVDDYNDCLSSLFRRHRGLPIATQVFIYINNCDVPGFKEHIMLQTPKTIKEAQNWAKLKESTLKAENKYTPYNEINQLGQSISPIGRPGPSRQGKAQAQSVNAVTPSGFGPSQPPRPMLSDVIGAQISTLFQDLTKSNNESFEKLNKSISTLTDVITKGFKEMSKPSSFRQNGMQPRPNQSTPPNQGGQNAQRSNFQNRSRQQGQGNSINLNNQRRTVSFVLNNEDDNSQGDETFDDDSKSDHINNIGGTFDDQTQDQEYEDDQQYSVQIVSPSWPSSVLTPSVTVPSAVNTASPRLHEEKTPEPSVGASTTNLQKKRVSPLFFWAHLVVDTVITKDLAKVIVDTGSGITLISLNLLTLLEKEMKIPMTSFIRQLPSSEMPILVGAALGSSLNVMGAITLTLKTGSVILQPMVFIVVANLTSDIILGGDELSNGKLFGSLNVAAQKLTYLGNKKKELIHLELQDTPSSPSSNLKGKKRPSPFVAGIKAPSLSVGNLSVRQHVKIPPHSSTLLLASQSLKGPNRNDLEKKFAGRLDNASFVISPTKSLQSSPLVSFQNILCDSNGAVLGGPSEIKVRLVNPSDQPVLISSGTVIANIEVFWADGVIPVQTIMKQIQRHELKMEEEQGRGQ
jgi:hypothetical protein